MNELLLSHLKKDRLTMKPRIVTYFKASIFNFCIFTSTSIRKKPKVS